MKNFLIIFVLVFAVNSFAIDPPASRAQGVFLAFGVGPRLPLGDFSNSTDIGYGFNIELSYTDNEFLPVFLFANIGFEQYPGAQSFYQETDYSNFSTNSIPINVGARYYFSPLIEQVVLLIPIIEFSASYTYTQELNEFKIDSGRNNFKEQFSKFGVSGGVGLSMFLMEIIAAYHYFESNQYVSFDLRIRIPLFINY
ncbi:MAG: outer membrane beta-barrel protein [Bacteroidetes bacterium]|nr:outer membrane beta-barrel protein [Bacteroidota bacterium]MCH7770420.1 outer membrane beta-barrel protein [Bacteroidota bacterium]